MRSSGPQAAGGAGEAGRPARPVRRLWTAWARAGMENAHIALVLLAGALYLASRFAREAWLADAGLWVLFLAVVSLMVHYNQHQLLEHLEMRSGVSYLPERRIRVANNVLLAGFMLVTGILMAVLPRAPLGELAGRIAALLRSVAGALLGLLFSDAGGSVGQGAGLLDVELEKGAPTARGSGLIDQLIAVLEGAAGVAAAVALAALVALGARWLLRRLLARGDGDGPVGAHEFVEVAEERAETRPAGPRRRPEAPGRGPSARVRRAWRREVARRARRLSRRGAPSPGAALLPFSTPSEAEGLVGWAGARREALHACYEKARYAEGGCGEEEAARALRARDGREGER